MALLLPTAAAEQAILSSSLLWSWWKLRDLVNPDRCRYTGTYVPLSLAGTSYWLFDGGFEAPHSRWDDTKEADLEGAV